MSNTSVVSRSHFIFDYAASISVSPKNLLNRGGFNIDVGVLEGELGSMTNLGD